MARKDDIILRELRQWRDDGLIERELHDTLAAKYQSASWDISVIIRWALILGAIMLGIGLMTFFLTIIQSEGMVAIVLTLLCGLSYYFGFSLISGRVPAICMVPYETSPPVTLPSGCTLPRYSTALHFSTRLF